MWVTPALAFLDLASVNATGAAPLDALVRPYERSITIKGTIGRWWHPKSCGVAPWGRIWWVPRRAYGNGVQLPHQCGRLPINTSLGAPRKRLPNLAPCRCRFAPNMGHGKAEAYREGA